MTAVQKLLETGTISEPQPLLTGFQGRYLEFSERPLSDSCWSVQTGPDGRVYIACCIEHSGGGTVTVVRYNHQSGKLDYLYDMDEVTGDRRDSGRATQCKVHYSFCPDPETNILYAATHLSGPPLNEKRYQHWSGWHDAKRSFRGAYLVAYDTLKDEVADVRLMIPKEGSRCMALDVERKRLYSITYPRDHFVSYCLRTHTLTDHGRIGSVNSEALILDKRGRVIFADDQGCLNRFDPEEGRIRRLPISLPTESYQTGWHAVLYDAIAAHDHQAVYMLPWLSRPHLARLWPDDGPYGKIEDLGPVSQESDPDRFLSINLDHAGGLAYGPDGWLYYTIARWRKHHSQSLPPRDNSWGVLMRHHPHTGEKQEVCLLGTAKGHNHYVSRAAIDQHGHLIMGKILTRPSGVYCVSLPGNKAVIPLDKIIRYWG